MQVKNRVENCRRALRSEYLNLGLLIMKPLFFSLKNVDEILIE
jgi:hypothetical protein